MTNETTNSQSPTVGRRTGGLPGAEAKLERGLTLAAVAAASRTEEFGGIRSILEHAEAAGGESLERYLAAQTDFPVFGMCGCERTTND